MDAGDWASETGVGFTDVLEVKLLGDEGEAEPFCDPGGWGAALLEPDDLKESI